MLFGPKYIVIDLANFVARMALVRSEDDSTIDGYPTGHVYRAFQSLSRLRRTGATLVYAHEGADQFRYKIFEAYKAERRAKKEKLASTEPNRFNPEPDIHILIRLIGGILIYVDTGEADDAIATFVDRYHEKSHVISTDHDLWALLEYPHVKVFAGQSEITPQHVHKRHDVYPSQMPLFKGLKGDKSDGLPSVPRLLWRHVKPFFTPDRKSPTPDEFLDWAEEGCPPKTYQKLLANAEQIRLITKVATLRTDLPYHQEVIKGNKEKLRKTLAMYGHLDALEPYIPGVVHV